MRNEWAAVKPGICTPFSPKWNSTRFIGDEVSHLYDILPPPTSPPSAEGFSLIVERGYLNNLISQRTF